MSSSPGHGSVWAFLFCLDVRVSWQFDPSAIISKLWGKMSVSNSTGLKSWEDVFDKYKQSAKGNYINFLIIIKLEELTFEKWYEKLHMLLCTV